MYKNPSILIKQYLEQPFAAQSFLLSILKEISKMICDGDGIWDAPFHEG